MGADIQKGTIYSEGGVGGAGTVNANNLNAHVDEARIKATFISAKSLRTDATLSDSIVVEAGGVLYRSTFQQVIDLIGNDLKVPVGSILDFAGSSAPGGWLLCFGQTVLRETYPELFDVIGTSYGSTDSTNFKLPDLRGRVAAGKDDMGGPSANRLTSAAGGVDGITLGAGGGTQSHTLTIAQMPSHTHTLNDNTSSLLAAAGIYAGTVPTTTYNTVASTVANTTATTGGGAAHPIVQPTVIVNKIIRYQ